MPSIPCRFKQPIRLVLRLLVADHREVTTQIMDTCTCLISTFATLQTLFNGPVLPLRPLVLLSTDLPCLFPLTVRSLFEKLVVELCRQIGHSGDRKSVV